MMRTHLLYVFVASIILSLTGCASMETTANDSRPPTYPHTDFDGDGVVDWEDDDDDNDGFSDAEELAGGSDPRDPGDIPED